MNLSNIFIASVLAIPGALLLLIFLDYALPQKVRFIVTWLLLVAFAIFGVEELNSPNQDNTPNPVVRVP
jgi:ABC-type multidrug transport system permease subunit